MSKQRKRRLSDKDLGRMEAFDLLVFRICLEYGQKYKGNGPTIPEVQTRVMELEPYREGIVGRQTVSESLERLQEAGHINMHKNDGCSRRVSGRIEIVQSVWEYTGEYGVENETTA